MKIMPRTRLALLSHYTQLPVLLDILERKRIVLGNPDAWDDKTDANMLKKYAESKNMDNIRLLCLTENPDGMNDNILHWNAYASGKAGCRINFDKKKLLKIAREQGAVLKEIDYLNSEELENQPDKWRRKLPFLKRSPYAFENEWRVMWLGTLKKDEDFELDISKELSGGLIKSVRLSPELPKSLAKNLRSFLEKRYKKYRIKFVQSWVLQNPDWERTVKKSLPSPSTNRRKP